MYKLPVGVDWDDVRQAQFLLAWEDRDKFDPQRAGWSTFVGLKRLQVLRGLRRKARTVSLDRDLPHSDPSPLEILCLKEEKELAVRAVRAFEVCLGKRRRRAAEPWMHPEED